MQKRKVLSLEWKSEGVMDDDSGELSGDGGSCFGIEVWMDTAKLANMVIARFGDR